MRRTRFCDSPRSFVQLLRAFPTRVASGLAAMLLVALASTWRRSFASALGGLQSNQPPGLYVLAHNSLLMGVIEARGLGYSTMISMHRDGSLVTEIATWLGLRVIRGSSSRRAHGALVELERRLEAGELVTLTGDGPRGPRGVIKAGLVAAASRTQCQLVPVAWAVDSYWEMPSWDMFRVPRPFARVHGVCGAPIPVPESTDREAVEACRLVLQERLMRLTNQLEERAGLAPPDRSTLGSAGDRARLRGRGVRVVRAVRPGRRG